MWWRCFGARVGAGEGIGLEALVCLRVGDDGTCGIGVEWLGAWERGLSRWWTKD